MGWLILPCRNRFHAAAFSKRLIVSLRKRKKKRKTRDRKKKPREDARRESLIAAKSERACTCVCEREREGGGGGENDRGIKAFRYSDIRDGRERPISSCNYGAAVFSLYLAISQQPVCVIRARAS